MHSGVDFEDFLSSSPEAFKNKNEDQEGQGSLKQEEESPTKSNQKQTTKIVRVVVCLSQRIMKDVSDSFLIAKRVRLLC